MNSKQSIREQVSEAEWRVRVDLAACYRAIALYGWDDLVFTHVSARVPGPDDHFLINAYGLLFEEITASSLVKVDLRGEKVTDCCRYPRFHFFHTQRWLTTTMKVLR